MFRCAESRTRTALEAQGVRSDMPSRTWSRRERCSPARATPRPPAHRHVGSSDDEDMCVPHGSGLHHACSSPTAVSTAEVPMGHVPTDMRCLAPGDRRAGAGRVRSRLRSQDRRAGSPRGKTRTFRKVMRAGPGARAGSRCDKTRTLRNLLERTCPDEHATAAACSRRARSRLCAQDRARAPTHRAAKLARFGTCSHGHVLMDMPRPPRAAGARAAGCARRTGVRPALRAAESTRL